MAGLLAVMSWLFVIASIAGWVWSDDFAAPLVVLTIAAVFLTIWVASDR